jgi:hypothetical protein
MKRTMFVALGLLFGLSMLIFSDIQARKNGGDTLSLGQQSARFEMSNLGTLSYLRTMRGVEFKMPSEGFSLTYQLLDKKGKNPKSRPREIYAIGATISGDLLECKVCKQGVATTATTKDGVLKVNTNFHLDERLGVLKVVRFIQNLSDKPVRILSAKVQVDGRLTTGEPARFGVVDFQRISQMWPQPGRTDVLVSNLMPPNFQPFNLPCEFCPPHCEKFISVSSGERKVVCVQCEENGDIVWDFKPLRAGESVDPATCPNPVIANGWNYVPAGFSRPPKREVICIDCPGAEQQHHTSSGGATDAALIASERAKGKCKFAVTIDREGDKTIAGGLNASRWSLVTHMTAPEMLETLAPGGALRRSLPQQNPSGPGKSNDGAVPVSQLEPRQVIGIANDLNVR